MKKLLGALGAILGTWAVYAATIGLGVDSVTYDSAPTQANLRSATAKTGTLTVTNNASVSNLTASVAVFAGTASVNDDAYSASTWNGSTNVPTKNAVRDKFELLWSEEGNFLDARTTLVASNRVPVYAGTPTNGAITGITKANPAVVTSNSHGRSNGDQVWIESVGGMTEVNDRTFTVANAAANTFELSGVDSSAYTAYTSGGTWRYGRMQYAPLSQMQNFFCPRGYIDGLTLSNNGTDSTNDIDIAVGEAASSDTPSNRALMVLSAALTKRIDASWAVGSGNGGMDTGSVADSTWYHVHLIMRPDTGVVDALFSLSPTAPTLPANYTKSRIIGSVYRNASSSIERFTQLRDGLFLWSAFQANSRVNNPGTSAVLRTMRTPLGIKCIAIIRAQVYGASTTTFALTLSSPDQDDETAANVYSEVSYPTAIGAVRVAARVSIPTNTSSQIRSRCSASSASVDLDLGTTAFIHPRGGDL